MDQGAEEGGRESPGDVVVGLSLGLAGFSVTDGARTCIKDIFPRGKSCACIALPSNPDLVDWLSLSPVCDGHAFGYFSEKGMSMGLLCRENETALIVVAQVVHVVQDQSDSAMFVKRSPTRDELVTGPAMESCRSSTRRRPPMLFLCSSSSQTQQSPRTYPPGTTRFQT